jgi:outer membrane lipoprotein-sorting protein
MILKREATPFRLIVIGLMLAGVMQADTFAHASKPPIPTKTTLAASSALLCVGESMTLRAVVVAAKGSTPTGSVNFLNGVATLGQTSLDATGVAILKLTPAIGEYLIKAIYGGNGKILAASTSQSVPVSVVGVKQILDKLDATSKTFKSAEADILWENVQTKPIEDKDSQAGTILVARDGGETKLAMHIKTDNGSPALKDMVYANGTGKMYQPAIKQMQVFKIGDNKAALDAFLTLGFGGSGQDLSKNWNITLLGTESVNGVSAVKLQLAPKDAKMAESTPKVLLWIDMNQGLAVKQQRFQNDGTYVVFTYSNIHLNGKVPSGAFEIKTASGTQIVNH